MAKRSRTQDVEETVSWDHLRAILRQSIHQSHSHQYLLLDSSRPLPPRLSKHEFQQRQQQQFWCDQLLKTLKNDIFDKILNCESLLKLHTGGFHVRFDMRSIKTGLRDGSSTGSRRSIEFKPQQFFKLFEDNEDENHVTLLPRTNKGAGAFTQSVDDSHLIGGTLILRGPSREIKKLKRVVELGIYAVCHLRLEIDLMHDLLQQQVLPGSQPMSSAAPSESVVSLAFAQVTPPQSIKSVQHHFSTEKRRTTRLDSPPKSSSTNSPQTNLWKMFSFERPSLSLKSTVKRKSLHIPTSARSRSSPPSVSTAQSKPTKGRPVTAEATGSCRNIRQQSSRGRSPSSTSKFLPRQAQQHRLIPGSFLYNTYYIQSHCLRNRIKQEEEKRFGDWELILGANEDELSSKEEDGDDDDVSNATLSISSDQGSEADQTSGFSRSLFQRFSHRVNQFKVARPPVPCRHLHSSSFDSNLPQNLPHGDSSLLAHHTSDPSDKVLNSHEVVPIDEVAEPQSCNKFERVALQISQSIFSISYGVKFPTPEPLSRLTFLNKGKEKDQDEMTIEKSQIGLGLIMKNNVSIEGFCRHQSIQFLLERVWINPSTHTIKKIENLDWIWWKYYDRLYSPPCQSTGRKGEDPTQDNPKHQLSGTIHEVINRLVNGNSGRSSALNSTELEKLLLVLAHKNSRIIISLEENDAEDISSFSETTQGLKEDITNQAGPGANLEEQSNVWASSRCKLCHQFIKPRRCSIGGLMVWFMKFLELVLYDFRLKCQNVACHQRQRQSLDCGAPLGSSVVRFFHVFHESQVGKKVKVEVETIQIYEVKLPKAIDPKLLNSEDEKCVNNDGQEQISKLATEINEFYASLFNRIQLIDEVLAAIDIEEKPQPTVPLPTTHTGKSDCTPPVPETTDSLFQQTEPSKVFSASSRKSTTLSRSKASSNEKDLLPVSEKQNFLQNLAEAFRNQQSQLIRQASQTRPSSLNNLRKPFVDSIAQHLARLKSWEDKHLSFLVKPKSASPALNRLKDSVFLMPTYAQSGAHALPCDNSVIIREDEFSSIIAFTLSSGEYKRQLRHYKQSVNRPGSGLDRLCSRQTPSVVSFRAGATQAKRDLSLPIDILTGQPNQPFKPDDQICSSAKSLSILSQVSPKPGADPDDESGKFGRNCVFKSKVEYRQVSNSILSLRGLSNQRSLDMGSFRSLMGSRVTSPSVAQEADPMTKASKSKDARFGEDRTLDELIKSCEPNSNLNVLSTKSQSISPAPVAALLSRSDRGDSFTVSISHAETHGFVKSSLQRRPRSSKSSQALSDNEQTMDASEGENSGTEETKVKCTRTLQEEEDLSIEILSDGNDGRLDSDQTPPASRIPSRTTHSDQPPMIPPSSSSRLVSPFQGLWTPKASSRVDSARSDMSEEDDEELEELTPGHPGGWTPHIKCSFEHGNKSFSCTVWYAGQFEKVRKGIGLTERGLVESLSRSAKYEPAGGKSKSKFIMTSDSKFILKSLVNRWNCSERDSLIEFAPKYFQHVLSDANDELLKKPTMMIKILGFFSLTVESLGENERVENDFMLMENLFYDRKIERKFDLKGIQTRLALNTQQQLVPASTSTSSPEAQTQDIEKTSLDDPKELLPREIATSSAAKSIFDAKLHQELTGKSYTGWDADWIDGCLGNLILIYPECKKLLMMTIENDIQFMIQNNLMDYSILVGVDSTRNQLVMGLIDVIGTFNLVKMIEFRGKKVLKNSNLRTEDVTVLPPDEYGDRIKKSVEKNFVAVPEKWSQSRSKEGQDDCLNLGSVF